MNLLTPRAIVDVYECRHRVTLTKTRGSGAIDIVDAETDELIVNLGHTHEAVILDILREALGVSLPSPRNVSRITPDLVNSYQPRIFTPDGELTGIPDFILDAAGLAALGVEILDDMVLEPVDAKLSRTTKDRALLQVAVYGEMITRLGYPRPARGHLVLSGETDGRPYKVESHSLMPLYPLVRSLMLEHQKIEPLAADERMWCERNAACGLCPFADFCAEGRRSARDLTLLANILPTQRDAFIEAGVSTIDKLAKMQTKPAGMDNDVYLKLKMQAVLRVDHLAGGPVKALWGAPANGFPSGPTTLKYPPERSDEGVRPFGSSNFLPAPDSQDIFFDFEGYPHAPRGGLEYLFGWITAPNGTPVFDYLWADDEPSEQVAFEKFVDWLVEHFEKYPSAHVYHYAPYEKTALKRLAEKYDSRKEEVETLLKADRFVDLYSIVRGAFLIGTGSYSIKKLEPLYMPSSRTGDVTSALASVQQYADYVKAVGSDPLSAQKLRQDILDYNEYDCVSTLELFRWLESNRKTALKGESLQGVVRETKESSEESIIRKARIAELEEILSNPSMSLSEETQNWHRTLGALVGYYEREEAIYWGDVLRKYDLADSDLAEDEDTATVLKVGRTLAKPRSRGNNYVELHLNKPSRLSGSLLLHAGSTLKSINTAKREALLDVAKESNVDISVRNTIWVEGKEEELKTLLSSRTLMHKSNVRPGAKQDVILTLAEEAAVGLAAPRNASAVVSRLGMNTTGKKASTPLDSALQAVAGLAEGSYVAVQGPPGAGKTYLAVEILKEAKVRGWVTGVSCVAHKAIENVLESATKAKLKTLKHNSAVKKWKDDLKEFHIVSWSNLPDAQNSILGGTAFAYASLAKAVLAGEAEPIDLLVVDEASQMPLVDFIAIAPSAKRIVLLGDPRQLPHVSQAAHPEGNDTSVLGHLVQEENVMPQKHGFFLDQTRRFPQGLASLISEIAYDGRLSAHPETASHHVGNKNGAYLIPVKHFRCSTRSKEEADAIATFVKEVVGSSLRTRSGDGIVTPKDIIVVAPYNDQVRTISTTLKDAGLENVRVGTVDRFQGQEAAIAVYSMTASSTHDAPRGPEFVLDAARLNVALSRAQAVAVVVGNPSLAKSYGTGVERLYSAARATRVLQNLPLWDSVP